MFYEIELIALITPAELSLSKKFQLPVGAVLFGGERDAPMEG